jgi:hypothetical protein
LAVKAVDVATPVAVVRAEVVAVVFTKVPLAPLPGAVKVTEVPAISTGLPCESSMVTARGLVKAVPTEAF